MSPMPLAHLAKLLIEKGLITEAEFMQKLSAVIFFLVFLLLVPINAQEKRTVFIDPLSTKSLLLELFAKKERLGTGTGFVVEFKSKRYLISNRHIFSGLDYFTKKAWDPRGRIPDELRINYHHRKSLQTWTYRVEKLRNDDGSPRWMETKTSIDVAALPITAMDDNVRIYPFDLKLADVDMLATPGMPVSIIGFPGGLSASGVSILRAGLKAGIHIPGFPIWKTGHIATDPELDFDGLPVFLIDATTRGGMSGSPVVLRQWGPYRSRTGKLITATRTRTLFLGVFSAQFKELELGYVWRPQVITDLLSKTQ